jgi:hypothetical protein
MSSVVLGIEQSDVLQGGQVVLLQMFETFIGSNEGAAASGVTIEIAGAATPGAGSGTPVPQTSAGVTTVDGFTYSYTWACAIAQAPGDYVVTWSGTGGLLGTVLTYAQAVTVAAIASGVPAAGVYANPGQYLAWSGDSSTPEWIVLVKLQRASEDIDRALMGAVYPVNANGMPTDPMVIDVLMRATCAQAQWLIGDNDDSGLKRQYLSTSVGGVSQTRAASMAALEMPPLAPRALSILHVSGVVPSAALIAW